MAITKNAKKAIRTHERKSVFNARRKKMLRTTIKNFYNTVAQGDINTPSEMLSNAYQAIDKAAKRGVIKKNTASRKKSRLTKLLARSVK